MEFAVLFKYYSDIFLTARAWIVRTFLWSLSNNLAISLYFRFISRRYIITDSSIVIFRSLNIFSGTLTELSSDILTGYFSTAFLYAVQIVLSLRCSILAISQYFIFLFSFRYLHNASNPPTSLVNMATGPLFFPPMRWEAWRHYART